MRSLSMWPAFFSLGAIGCVGVGYCLPWTGIMGSIVSGLDLLRLGLGSSVWGFLAFWPFIIALGPIVELITLGKLNPSVSIIRISSLVISTTMTFFALWLIVVYGYGGWRRIFEGYYLVSVGIMGLWLINGWRTFRP